MALVYRCDRCKEETGGKWNLINLVSTGHGTFDLCKICMDRFQNLFMKKRGCNN